MASKTPIGAPATRHDIVVQKDDRAVLLRKIGECASVLREVLSDDRGLHQEEFVFIDKHFQTLNIAYLRWKRKHTRTDEAKPSV